MCVSFSTFIMLFPFTTDLIISIVLVCLCIANANGVFDFVPFSLSFLSVFISNLKWKQQKQFRSLSTKFCDLSISRNESTWYEINTHFFLFCRKATFVDALCTTLTLTLYLYAIDFIWPMLSIFKISKKIYWLLCACVCVFLSCFCRCDCEWRALLSNIRINLILMQKKMLSAQYVSECVCAYNTIFGTFSCSFL